MPESVKVGAGLLRVVFADDDAAARALLRILLELVDGVEIVGEASDGHEAVLVCQETEPQLVILDLNMPRLEGLAAAEALLAANPDLQIVLHTSDPDSARIRRAAQLGIHINDKANPDALVERLEHAARRAGATPSTQNRLQAAVLAALLGTAPEQALIVATPDGQLPFYNHQAAEFLHWPFPPEPKLLATARESLPTFDTTGRRLWPDERPINRALATHQPMPAEHMVVLRDGIYIPIITGTTRCSTTTASSSASPTTSVASTSTSTSHHKATDHWRCPRARCQHVSAEPSRRGLDLLDTDPARRFALPLGVRLRGSKAPA